MRLLSVLLIIIALLMAIFVASNWTVLAQPTLLNFLAFQVSGPLGLILLGGMASLVLTMGIYLVAVRTAALVESRKLHRRLEEQRAAVDNAEASRYAELKHQVAREADQTRQTVMDTGKMLSDSLAEQGNALLANLGYVDDKISRLGGGATSNPKDAG